MTSKEQTKGSGPTKRKWGNIEDGDGQKKGGEPNFPLHLLVNTDRTENEPINTVETPEQYANAFDLRGGGLHDPNPLMYHQNGAAQNRPYRFENALPFVESPEPRYHHDQYLETRSLEGSESSVEASMSPQNMNGSLGSGDNESVDPKNSDVGVAYCARNGEMLHQQYRCISELDSGYFSTVWLCLNVEDQRFIAIKISKSGRNAAESALNELKWLLRTSELSDGGYRDCVIQMHDFFLLNAGDMKKHVCIITEVIGFGLHKLIERNKHGLTLSKVRVIADQLLQGLQYLHAKFIAHQDLHPGNVLVTVSQAQIAQLAKEAKEETNSGFFDKIIDAAAKEKMQLKFIDFGNACFAEDKYEDVCIKISDPNGPFECFLKKMTEMVDVGCGLESVALLMEDPWLQEPEHSHQSVPEEDYDTEHAAHSLVSSSSATTFASCEEPSLLIPSRPCFSQILHKTEPVCPAQHISEDPGEEARRLDREEVTSATAVATERTPQESLDPPAQKKPVSRPPSPPTPANPFASQRTLQRTPQEPLDPPAPKKPPQRPPSPKSSTNPFTPKRTLLRSPERPTQSPPEPPTTATPPESPPKRAEDCPLSQRTTEKNAKSDTQKKSPPRPPPPRATPKTATPPNTREKSQLTPPKEEQNGEQILLQLNRPLPNPKSPNEDRNPSGKPEPSLTTEPQDSERAKRLEERNKKKVTMDLKDLKTEMEKLGQAFEKRVTEDAARNLDLYPSFSGTKDDKTFHEFYTEFLRAGTALGHSYERMAVILPLKLKKSAKATYDMLKKDDKKSWATLTSALKRKFQPGDARATEEYAKLRQAPEETISEFAKRIQATVEVAFHSDKNYSDDNRDQLKKDALIRGVHPSIARQLQRRDPGSWEEAYELAEKEEQLPNPAPEAHLNAITTELRKTSETLKEGEEKNTEVTPKKEDNDVEEMTAASTLKTANLTAVISRECEEPKHHSLAERATETIVATTKDDIIPTLNSDLDADHKTFEETAAMTARTPSTVASRVTLTAVDTHLHEKRTQIASAEEDSPTEPFTLYQCHFSSTKKVRKRQEFYSKIDDNYCENNDSASTNEYHDPKIDDNYCENNDSSSENHCHDPKSNDDIREDNYNDNCYDSANDSDYHDNVAENNDKFTSSSNRPHTVGTDVETIDQQSTTTYKEDRDQHRQFVSSSDKATYNHGLRCRRHQREAEFPLPSICTQVNTTQIYSEYKIGNVCFAYLPVKVDERLLFVRPMTNDLIERSPIVDCATRTSPVTRNSTGWFSPEGKEEVAEVPHLIKYKEPTEDHAKYFTAPRLFQSELVHVIQSVELLADHAQRLNEIEHALRMQDYTFYSSPNSTGINWDKSGKLLNDAAVSTLTWIDKKGALILGFFDNIWNTLITIGVIIIIAIIASVLIYLRCILGGNPKTPGVNIVTTDQHMKAAVEMEPLNHETQNQHSSLLHNDPHAEVNYPTWFPFVFHVDYPSDTSEEKTHVGNRRRKPKKNDASTNKQPHVEVLLNGRPVRALLDSGAGISYCRRSIVPSNVRQESTSTRSSKCGNGSGLHFIGQFEAQIQIGSRKTSTKILISEDHDCPVDLLLGTQFMRDVQRDGTLIAFDMAKEEIALGDERIPMVATFNNAKSQLASEKAEENAFRACIPRAHIHGCFFHFGQAIWRKLQNLQLASRYLAETHYNHRISMFIALAFCDASDVRQRFDILSNDFLRSYGDSQEHRSFLEYMETTWIGRTLRIPLFPPEMWNCKDVTEQNLPRTNNSVESWHNAFKQALGSQHPNIFKVIEALKLEQVRVNGLYVRLMAGEEVPLYQRKEYRNANHRLLAVIQRYNTTPALDYLDNCAHYVAQ
ncbi:hypothetical protein QR680_011596 [Steinernema hermaphroditum]|uniref:non-specific serine/threonine protein kinase n=1 Tax=Steinernema hermaphroditum TaxID=289476 RepID=A0AA39I1N6_9BILA|nr:hypothetical protein QR680_011596 [Steinernema hermaphroditum]